VDYKCWKRASILATSVCEKATRRPVDTTRQDAGRSATLHFLKSKSALVGLPYVAADGAVWHRRFFITLTCDSYVAAFGPDGTNRWTLKTYD